MNIQKSFKNENCTLYIVPTPIGNLNEMTPRAIEILKKVDVIAAEDTRVTINLLNKFDIKNKVIQHQKHNEVTSSLGILNLLKEGKNIALVSDAGYPLISDPGYHLTNLIINEGFNVVSLSGSNAMLNALVCSGLSSETFTFIGFLSSKSNERVKQLNKYASYETTLIFYEAPHRIENMLKDCLSVLGDRKVCIARELTKLHEEFIRGNLTDVLNNISDIKGEIVVVVEGYQKKDEIIDEKYISDLILDFLNKGISKKEIVKEICLKTNLSKNYVYDLVNKGE